MKWGVHVWVLLYHLTPCTINCTTMFKEEKIAEVCLNIVVDEVTYWLPQKFCLFYIHIQSDLHAWNSSTFDELDSFSLRKCPLGLLIMLPLDLMSIANCEVLMWCSVLTSLAKQTMPEDIYRTSFRSDSSLICSKRCVFEELFGLYSCYILSNFSIKHNITECWNRNEIQSYTGHAGSESSVTGYVTKWCELWRSLSYSMILVESKRRMIDVTRP